MQPLVCRGEKPTLETIYLLPPIYACLSVKGIKPITIPMTVSAQHLNIFKGLLTLLCNLIVSVILDSSYIITVYKLKKKISKAVMS